MSNLGAQILTAIQGALPDGTCTVKSGRSVWAGWCSGLDEIKTATDQGQVAGFSGNVRYLKSAEPVEIKAGSVVEVQRPQDESYQKLRVSFRRENGGAVRLTVTAEFE
jgi:hypothetical protein